MTPHVHPLDNPVWASLTGPQQDVAERVGPVARYRTGISPFGAFEDPPGPGHWQAMEELVGPGGVVIVTGQKVAMADRPAPPKAPVAAFRWRGGRRTPRREIRFMSVSLPSFAIFPGVPAGTPLAPGAEGLAALDAPADELGAHGLAGEGLRVAREPIGRRLEVGRPGPSRKT